MGKADFIGQFQAIATTGSQATGRPFPYPIDGQDGRFFKGGRKKRAGGVRFVMVGEDQRPLVTPVESPADFPR